MKDLEKVTNDLKQKIYEEETKLKAWKEVSFPTKKDGTPYKYLAKNISGASYEKEQWAMQDGEYILTVYARIEGKRCTTSISDSIYCYKHVGDLTDEQKAKTENYLPKVSYLRQIYKLDLDDIKQEVNNRIEKLENRVKSLKAELRVCETAFNEYKNAMEIAQKQMEIARKQLADTVIINNDKTLYYMINETR